MERSTRRDLLKVAAAGAGVAWTMSQFGRRAVAAPKSMKILLLGGTAFLGPETVGAAIARGHTVTLFNRGKTNPHLFPDLERLRGDRNGDVSALEDRSFDAVIDTSAYVPAHVRRVAEVLGDRVGHYTLVSTISVYPGMGERRQTITEESPVATIPDETVEKVTGQSYGPLKALCERAAEQAWPGRVANVRPGLIVGPGDPTDRFAYWPVRVSKGGEILAPGDGTSEAQFIDVRDLGEWLVRAAEEGTVGVYNAVGFPGRLSFMEMLHGAKCAIRTDCSFTWVAEEVLKEHKVLAWHNLPLWLPSEGSTHFANDRALAKGLSFRPVARTIAETLAWTLETNREVTWGVGPKAGLASEREAQVLAAWRAKDTAK